MFSADYPACIVVAQRENVLCPPRLADENSRYWSHITKLTVALRKADSDGRTHTI